VRFLTNQVMRLPERLQSLLLKWKAVTISQKKRADEYAYPHEYGMQYAYMMVFFATILTFSTIAPLILPFGTLYFMCKHFLDTYLLVHVRPREFDSDGSMLWYAQLNHIRVYLRALFLVRITLRM
jgi:hypothetical protein